MLTLRELKAHLFLIRTGGIRRASTIFRLGRSPIVIGGCGRSGTTLLLSILSCHPHIFAVDTETRTFCHSGYSTRPTLNAPFHFKKLYRYLLNQQIPAAAKRWCEKTPRNVLFYDRILRYYGPRVRILNIVRDGRDVISSVHPSNPAKFWVTPERWIMDVSAGKLYGDHPQVFTLRYEDLVNDCENIMRAICRFLGEDFHDDFLSYSRATAVQHNAAWFDKARPLDTSSIGRWQRPECADRVAELLANPEAVALLTHYNYIG